MSRGSCIFRSQVLSSCIDFLITNAMDALFEIFNNIITQTGSIDIAEAEFKRQMNEDPELRTLYREWCHEVGSSEKRGFLDYCEEYLDSQDEIWQNLTDFDDHE